MFRRNDYFGRGPLRLELVKFKKKVHIYGAVTIRYHTPRPVELCSWNILRKSSFCCCFFRHERAWKERTVADYYVALNRVVGSNSDLEPNWINIYNNIIDVIHKVFEFSFYKIIIIIITTTTLVCPPYWLLLQTKVTAKWYAHTSLKLLLQTDYYYYYFGVFVVVLGRYVR